MLITKLYKPSEIDEAAKELRHGELIAFPTETVYGLGADATNEQAVKRVYLAKGRPSDNPLIVTVSSIEMVKRFVPFLDERVKKIMNNFWPGSLTIVLNIKKDSLPKAVTGGLKTAAFRMPNNQATLNLISKLNRPIVGPSANSSGKPSPTTAQHVYHDLNGRIAGIVDDGPTVVGVESTIIDMSTNIPTILRPGVITAEKIEKILGENIISDKHKVKDEEIPKAPGMKYKHYAPTAQVLMVKDEDWKIATKWAKKHPDNVGILAEDKIIDKFGINMMKYSLGNTVESATKNLFAGLRFFDDNSQIKYILAQVFSDEGMGLAYMNRLKKSSGNQFYEKDK